MGKLLQVLLGLISIINLIIGLFITFCSCYYIVTLGMSEYIPMTSNLMLITFILLIVGIFIITYTTLAFHGLRKRQSKYLKAFSALVMLFLIIQICSVILAHIFKTTVVKKVDDIFTEAVVDEKEYMNTHFFRYMDVVQFSLGCCGKSNYRDYSLNIKELPLSCCRAFNACNKHFLNTTLNDWDNGCMELVMWGSSPVVLSLMVLVFVVEILMIILGWMIKFRFISIGKFINENARGMNTMMSMH